MIIKYRGFEIEAKRERAMGGWMACYYSAIRLSDGWVMVDDIGGEGDTVRDVIEEIKGYVDDYHENPEDWED